ncbi:Hypothetical protein FKW44_013618 [Caligus rogercresseyi]|uniref:Uncharacterized protein n=1 Tax=Caligus rogercresseyi TaxID=217165 RepID=A0A7T8JZT9_CALRO|nr:Hypothetical protein FKW44_013618 [Caligus rogercresseyi]
MKILKATVSGTTVYRAIKAFKELGKVSRRFRSGKICEDTAWEEEDQGETQDKFNLIHETDA